MWVPLFVTVVKCWCWCGLGVLRCCLCCCLMVKCCRCGVVLGLAMRSVINGLARLACVGMWRASVGW